MASLFTKEVRSTGNRRELFLYFRGRLFYKAWYLDNQKQSSKLFHTGEGLTLEAGEHQKVWGSRGQQLLRLPWEAVLVGEDHDPTTRYFPS